MRTKPLLLVTLAATCIAFAAAADVTYVEEITSSGLVKKSKFKTVNKVYIKGRQQKVRSSIKADKKTAKALEKQGQSLDASTILQIDRKRLYDINHVANTYAQKRLPGLQPAARKPSFPPMPMAKPDIAFKVKALDETKKINGIECQLVAAEMRARYYQGSSKKVRRVNRYLYKAWMATDFPGSDEIDAFNADLSRNSSYVSGNAGGLEQLRDAVDNYDELIAKMNEELKGFPMQSQIKVFVKKGNDKEKQVFQITRKVNSISTSTIPKSEFRVGRGLKKVSPN